MVICFKCPTTTKIRLDALLQSGSFTDYSEIINAAIENFSVLHEEVLEKGSIILEGQQVGKVARVSEEARITLPKQSSEVSRSAGIAESHNTNGVPELFRLGSSSIEADLAPLPTDVFFKGQPVSVDRWIFGQFSKLLPAKASCRALSRLYPAPANGFELEKVATRLAQEAENLTAYLSKMDQKRGLSRDEAWAVGFPSGANNADRSRLRYANQFVGSIGKQGTLVGLLIDLKFINLTRSGSKRILLTQAGWDFALMENPALDGISDEGKFAAAEVSFLLRHIQDHVPVEDFAFRTILGAIKEGHDTPDKLDEIARQHIPSQRQDEITNAFVTTQRSGAIARMIDLGLISRSRDGLRVSYSVTELGQQYVEGTRAA